MYTHKNGLTLKKIERDDLKGLKALKDESWFGTHNIAIINMDEQNKWYESVTNNQKHIIMIAKDGQRNVGVFKIKNIDWMNQKCDIAYDNFKNMRGKGYGKKLVEAGIDFIFEILNLHRIDTEILENNLASLKCCEYAGFIREGLKRKCIRKCNQWLDSIFYGLLREDWEKLGRVKELNGVCNINYEPKDGRNDDRTD